MKELKTLKDIKHTHWCEEYNTTIASSEELRQEAINWVKHLRINPYEVLLNEFGIMPLEVTTDKLMPITYMGVNIQQWAYFLEQFIKHQYNITEEDLK